MSTETRLLGALVLPLLAAILAGCQVSERQVDPCDCPNTETVVASIDWFGDGSSAAALDSQQFEEGVLSVALLFDHFEGTSDATTALDRLFDRLVAAGLESGRPPDYSVGIELEVSSATVTITPPLLEGLAPTGVEIEVGLMAEDSEAREALQPLIDALGTID